MKRTGIFLLSVVMSVMLVLTACGDGGGDSPGMAPENGTTGSGTGGLDSGGSDGGLKEEPPAGGDS
ncbi:hypothetical protein [Paenibacillus sp. J2TS4]|uniref:hypothetical protein n=1 Tax=Paenibacillus sp. J2TS4 TaxID=2807194 RepID=UPI001B12172F|nr:hypothetical protein [Paenibacillus sp. J2TS4]GIP34839.1 hypothetical protein J2TS4_40490 [Paenibacillus sp. J2TS4]